MRYEVYLETSPKRTFASALEWPGWVRHGPTEEKALAALFAYAPRYEAILADTGLGFRAPADPSEIVVVERLIGNATTEFGALAIPPSVDEERSVGPEELARYRIILEAGWRAFDRAVENAHGKELAKGPRGGGRSLEGIVKHVLEADAGYLSAVGWKAPRTPPDASATDRIAAVRKAILDAIVASAAGRIAPTGPRGGTRWTARFFMRRVIWHVISHAWEIERRLAAAHPVQP